MKSYIHISSTCESFFAPESDREYTLFTCYAYISESPISSTYYVRLYSFTVQKDDEMRFNFFFGPHIQSRDL